MARILLVDDSPLVRNAMQAALEPYGVELAHAENGEVAVAKVASSRWDLIFLDVVMPVMDGPTALAEIRSRGIRTPVVLVTSVASASVVASAVKLGGVQYISKPFTPELIRSVAAKMLNLDPEQLKHPPRVLLQHRDPELPQQLARCLPAHIAIDATSSLSESLDLAESRGGHELVIFEPQNLADEGEAIASVLRDMLPAAGIFAIDPSGTSEPWHPEGPLDGVLPTPLDSAIGRGFLYPNFLRRLVFFGHETARAAGFQGARVHAPAYLAMVERVLCDRCPRLDLSLDLEIDLLDLDAEPEVVAELMKRLHRDLRSAGAAPAFRAVAAATHSLGAHHALMV